MYSSLYAIIISLFNLIISSQSSTDHWQPFGTVGSLVNIEEIHGEYPNVSQLFTYYIPKLKPVVSRQVLVNDANYDMWMHDEKLEHEVEGLSKITIIVDSLKERKRLQMKFGDFIDRYEKDALFFADTIPEVFRKYIVVPRPFQCDEVTSTLHSAILVMNGVNMSPLIYNEDFNSLLCLFRGNKRMVLVNTGKYPAVRQVISSDHQKSPRPPLNPEQVDFEQYPELENVEYHVANLTSGDCLFIPNEWAFQERSLEKTISIIYNIHHKHALTVDLNELQNCLESNTFDSSYTLDQIDWSSMENQPKNLREIVMSLVESKGNTFDKWQKTFSQYFSFDINSDPDVSSMFDEFYGIIDMDGNGEITKPEVEQIHGPHQHHISDILYEMIQLINNRQKLNTTATPPVNSDAEENEEPDVDHHEKTDL